MRSGGCASISLLAMVSFAGCGLVLDTGSDGRDDGGSSPDGGSVWDGGTRRDAVVRLDASVDGAVADAAGADGALTDGSTGDARVADGSPHDASSSPDASRRDGGAADAGSATDAGPCGTLGTLCMGDGDCSTTETCDEGVCIPALRPTCGGFAGATCPAEYTDCPYCTGCDFGYCLTSVERDCICAKASTRFVCM